MSKIPITLGIIGHLDSVVSPKHTEVIIQILDEIHARYPNSPITLFSQLAKGADTQIANIFIEQKEKKQKDYNLVAPLPLKKADYIKKFTIQEKEQFQELLSKSEKSFILDEAENSTKDDLYRAGGKFIADSSIILIALWDGAYNNKKGGTSDIVKYKITGSFSDEPEDYIFEQDGSLISILCNRANDSKKIILEENYLETLLKDQSIEKALDKIEDFNKSIKNINPEDLKKSENYLFPENINLNASNKTLKSYYAITDTKAIEHQNKYNIILKGLFIIGFIIFGFFETYKHLGLKDFFFFATLALLAIAYTIYKLFSNSENHEKFIEDRVLAESLRVQFFWNIKNINKSVSDYILRIHKNEYSWLKHILLAIIGLTYNDGKENIKTSIIKGNWIDDQKIYFKKKLEELHSKEKKNKLYSKLLFILGLIFLVAIFFVHHHDHHHYSLHPLIVLDSMCFGLYALLKTYFEKKGYEQTKTQFESMLAIYEASSKKIEEIEQKNESSKENEINKILYLTGKEAVVENGNWYMIYKDKEPEVEGIG